MGKKKRTTDIDIAERKGLINYDHIPSINSKPIEIQMLSFWG
jgi:hypothetical protein